MKPTLKPAATVAAALLATVAPAACDTDDGRQMRPPTEPLPATTTTTLAPTSTLGG